jgi:hypothetical protein
MKKSPPAQAITTAVVTSSVHAITGNGTAYSPGSHASSHGPIAVAVQRMNGSAEVRWPAWPPAAINGMPSTMAITPATRLTPALTHNPPDSVAADSAVARAAGAPSRSSVRGAAAS